MAKRMRDVGKVVTGGWLQKSQGYLQGQVIVPEGSLGRLHLAEHQVCPEAGLFWMHGKIAS